MGLTSKLIPQETSEPLSARCHSTVLTHQLPRQESAKGHLRALSSPREGDRVVLCSGSPGRQRPGVQSQPSP